MGYYEIYDKRKHTQFNVCVRDWQGLTVYLMGRCGMTEAQANTTADWMQTAERFDNLTVGRFTVSKV